MDGNKWPDEMTVREQQEYLKRVFQDTDGHAGDNVIYLPGLDEGALEDEES